MVQPSRVAVRHLLGGVLTAPPAMHKAILEWVIAVKAAREQEQLLASRSEGIVADREQKQRFQAFRAAIMALRAAPTSWETYKTYYDMAWIFGHPGTRWNVKDFQKMTPEKAEVLAKRVTRATDDYLERLDFEDNRPSRAEQIDADLERLKPFLRPGVKAGETTRKFPIDLSGWKYDEKEIEDRIRAQIRQQAQDILDALPPPDPSKGGRPAWMEDMIRDLKERATSGVNTWKTITVVINPKTSEKFSGHWQAASRTLTVTMPHTLSSYHLQPVSQTIQHELVHFAQTYLSEMVKGIEPTRAGLPSRRIRTPEYRQEYSPSHPNFNQNSPDVQRLVQQLRQKGLDIRQVDFHSLDDVEFYSKLGDDIAQFKRLEQHNSPMSRKEVNLAVRAFVDAQVRPETDRDYAIISAFKPSSFFKALHKRARGKWQKAVAELTKAVL